MRDIYLKEYPKLGPKPKDEEEAVKFLELWENDMKNVSEHNALMLKKSLTRIRVCAFIHGFIYAFQGYTKNRFKHFSWCPAPLFLEDKSFERKVIPNTKTL